MIKQYQVTLYCATGQYKPVSAIVKRTQKENSNLLLDEKQKKEIIKQGVIKICQKRYWTKQDILKYHYTKVKTREYTKEV